ncbi:DUF2625 domain-containing protein [Rufibacter roseolus]|uniref:DUF2625 domain-containing protein n=1 Tax=Rufibacter roseolus TaxID=2817375 RepID=UPI001B301CF5|nr:DUF2625 domain-containing protein [Rufibacter roseolus]
MKYLLSCLFLFIYFLSYSQPQSKKPLKELIDPKASGWSSVKGWIKGAKNNVEVLPKTQANANAALLQAQVTTRSPMGAVIYETGGILIDGGWLRILGSGSPRLPRSLMAWNKGKSYLKDGQKPSFLLVADDVLGGFFAVNSGGLSKEEIGKVFYISPDNLLWESSGLGYSEFLQFCFSGNLESFYEGMRWKNWRADVQKITGNQGIHCYPYLWSKESKGIDQASRKAIPIQELWSLYSGQKK